MNLPNRLTVTRLILVPLCMLVVAWPVPNDPSSPVWVWQRIIAAALFLLISLTDMLDGMIARKRNLVTDFGKFLDPLADKFLVIGVLLAMFLMCRDYGLLFNIILCSATVVVVMRELAVTSLRLLVSSKSGTVIAASWLGKLKTNSQIICIMTILLEPLFFGAWFRETHLLSYFMILLMTVMTVWSGVDYIRNYWKFLDPTR